MNEPPTSDQPAYNLSSALARLGGNRELLYEMIDFYLEDYETLLQRIDAAAEAGDPIALKRGAHSLKGLAANFDGVEVVESANTVIQASQDGFGRAPWDEIKGLSKAANQLAEQLQANRNDKESSG
ncbi:Hpt domain-containing protein [Adhaeretor mobilis]|uniref:Hpt domain protein n=1 Tax=Adhaeretor mobilis TaxID=1930276 RepID=A0A517MX62_9BACT|nr:Hpt domain-containing protein [Adhaeretor mobilis]QDS99466.1 Hpt domain protein [Adhaeretor mobilis]